MLFENKEEELRELKKIKINNPDIQIEQKNLLFSYYSIKDGENIDINYPNLIINYQKQFKNFFEEKKNDGEENKSEKYLLIGNGCKQVNIDEKPKYEENKNSSKLKFNDSISIVLPEIELNYYNEHLSLKNLNELFNKCIIGSRIFPAYLQIAIINKNDENLMNSKNYFDILYSMYKNKKENDNSIIKEKYKDFISSFEDMIVKLKDTNIDFKSVSELNKINKNINNKNPFIKIPDKIETMPQKVQWENKNIIEQNIEKDFKIEMMKKIENSIFKAEQIKKIDINDINLNRINNSELNSFENESNNNIKIEDNEEEIKFDDILNEINKDEEILLFDDENDKIEKKIIEFSSDTPISKISKEEFENLEKKFNEDYALKYIVDKMKNKINKNDLNFKYELIKSNLKGYFPNNKNLYHEIDSLLKEGEKLSVSSLFENSKFLSSKIIATVSQINSNEENEEIPFNKIEANILIDLARTISNENRFFNMLMVCGLAYALYSLKISYTLNIIGDSDMKVRIKNIDEPHSELIFQKLYDCCFIKRNVTQLPTCLKYFIDNFPP